MEPLTNPGRFNLYLVNGAVVNANLAGQAQPLYIEDAIQEITTSSSAISAEYGHLNGGVVNVVTKSGGRTADSVGIESRALRLR